MALMIDNKSNDYFGESHVWDALKNNLDDNIIVYNNREINGREYDFALLIEKLGILVIEVKGWTFDSIVDVQGIDRILIRNHSEAQRSPKKQARIYRFDWLDLMRKKFDSSPIVMDMVCYPFLTEDQYKAKRLNILSEPEFTLFKEDLADSKKIFGKITKVLFNKRIPNSTVLDDLLISRIRKELEPNYQEADILCKEKDYYHSILEVHTHELNTQELEKIVDNYFHGTKYFLFFNNELDLKKLLLLLEENFNSRGIIPEKIDLRFIKDNEKYSIKFENSYYRIFNLEAYVCGFSDDLEEGFTVYEGLMDEAQKALLRNLSETTNFNLEQYLIEHVDSTKNIIVRAGAGTGKTYTMVSRIAFLCNRKCNPITDLSNELVMITFTNEAANNMKSRLKQMFINYFILTQKLSFFKFIEAVEITQISTMHVFAKKIIQKANLHFEIGYDFTISNNQYLKSLLYEKYLDEYLVNETKNHEKFSNKLKVPVYQLKKILLSFSNQLYNRSFDIKSLDKNQMGTMPEYPIFNELIENVIKKAEDEYSRKIKLSNKIDLNELMIKLNKVLMDENIELNLNYKYLFIDEFQDTDDVQINSFNMLKELVKDLKLFVVGDVKQSIYRFRGATISAFSHLNTSAGEWIVKTLNTNYRTDYRLQDVFNEMFENLGTQQFIPYDSRVDKIKSKIKTNFNANHVVCKEYSSQKDDFYNVLFDAVQESSKIIEEQSRVNKISKEEKTIAILVRDNKEILNIINEAKKRNLHIETKVAGDLYQLISTTDLYKLCSALAHPTIPTYLYNFIESNYININLDIYGLYGLSDQEKYHSLKGILDSYLKDKMDLDWDGLIFKMQNEPVLKILKNIHDKLKPWLNCSTVQVERQFYKANLEMALETIINRFNVSTLTINKLSEYLRINIITRQKSNAREIQIEEVETRIVCTTIHKSKGLEYGIVIIPNTSRRIDYLKIVDLDVTYTNNKLSYAIRLDNEILTNSNYEKEEERVQQVNEESRVFYVAITRAIGRLVWLKDIDCKTNKSSVTWREFLEVNHGNNNSNIPESI